MYRRSRRLLRRATVLFGIGAVTATAAGAATLHRLAVEQTAGSLGATSFIQSSTGGGALQANTGAAVTTVRIPFGAFGTFNASGSPFGIGIAGTSMTGYGVAAESFSDTQPSILAYSGANGPGLEAMTRSNNPSNSAILALPGGTGNAIVSQETVSGDSGSAAVYGEDTAPASPSDNDGVLGTTTSGSFGVEGQGGNDALAGVAGNATTSIGVLGFVDLLDSRVADGVDGIAHEGAYFTSGVGVSVFGLSRAMTASGAAPTTAQDAGVYGRSQAGPGVIGVSDRDKVTPSNGRFVAIFGQSTNGDGLYASSSNYVGAYISNNSTYPTLEIQQNTAGGNALVFRNPSSTIATIDGNGDLTIAGAFTASGSTFARTRAPASDRMSYNAQSTEATIDDVGSARLVNGRAAVALQPDFLQTIDASKPYMVIVTPYADCNVLYVATKTVGGFVIRESRGGHSNIAFDYRVVARPFGAPNRRLPHSAFLHPDPTREAAMNGGLPPRARALTPVERRPKRTSTFGLRARTSLPIPSAKMPTRTQLDAAPRPQN